MSLSDPTTPVTYLGRGLKVFYNKGSLCLRLEDEGGNTHRAAITLPQMANLLRFLISEYVGIDRSTTSHKKSPRSSQIDQENEALHQLSFVADEDFGALVQLLDKMLGKFP